MYNTREEMMLDTTEPEHEYGIVYGDKTQPVTEGMSATQFVCKETVVLDSAITSSLSWYDNSHGLNIRFTGTSARIMYYGTSIKSVSYTSSDGITYTTTATLADRTFEGDFTFSSTLCSWIPQISDFLIAGGMYFEGMYEYVNEADEEWFDAITGITLTGTTLTSQNEERYLPTLTPMMKKLYDSLYLDANNNSKFMVYEQNGTYYAQVLIYRFGIKTTNDNCLYLAITSQYNQPVLQSNRLYQLDLETAHWTELSPVTADFIAGQGGDTYGWKTYNLSNVNIIGIFESSYIGVPIVYIINGSSTSSSSSYTLSHDYGHISFLTWHHVKTEFTLESPDELLPGKIALGKHGPITGTDEIWNNTPQNVIYEHLGLSSAGNNLYGPPTDYFSNVYDNDKLTYLTKNSNGQYLLSKPSQSHYISFVLDEGEYLDNYSPVFSDDMQYAVVMSYLYDKTTSKYTYTIRFYNNGTLCHTRVLHTNVSSINYFGGNNFCGRGFHNHDFYFTDMLDKVIYKYDCDQNIWSTYTNQYGPFGLMANKYMVMGKYNSGSSAMTNSIRIQNLDTGTYYDYTYYGTTSAGSWTEIPTYKTDGTNMYCAGRGSSSSTSSGYVYIVTPTNCTRISTSRSWPNYFNQDDEGTYVISLDSTHRLLIPRSYSTPLYMPVINLSNNTVQVISYSADGYSKRVNVYGQLVIEHGEGGDIVIYNGDELSISNGILVIPQKTAQIADFTCGNSNQRNWKNRKSGNDSISLSFSYGCSFWSERDGKIYFETNHTTSEPTITIQCCRYPLQIECTRCDKTNTKPADMTDCATLIQAYDGTSYKQQINTIVFGDNILGDDSLSNDSSGEIGLED